MRALLAGALLLAGAAGIAYLAFALRNTYAFGHRRTRQAAPNEFCPPVTIFKPLCGNEPGLFENLCSFCDQDYPRFQVIFGVRDAGDPGIAVARRVIERFPDCDLSLTIDDRTPGSNLKMASVLNMFPGAKHDIFIIADSDIRVDRAYLRSVVAPFRDPSVGAVTCLYRGEPFEATLPSRLGAMFINDQFAPSVLVALALSPADFCLGATMAVTRPALRAIGGFEAIASHLADDQMLGKLVRARGLGVELSSHVVENAVWESSFGGLWEHELRWARTMASARRAGYAFSFITYALPLCALYLLVSGDVPLALPVVGIAAALRISLHYVARWALDVRGPDPVWLVPLRDMLGLAVWGASFFGREVRWRDRRFDIASDGRLRPRSEPAAPLDRA
jgi:ceramide glucosyltransferase